MGRGGPRHDGPGDGESRTVPVRCPPRVRLVARIAADRTVVHVTDLDQHCRRLSEHLAALGAAMDELVYHLEVHVLVLTAGATSRIARSSRDVERSATVVAEAELARTEFVRSHVPGWSALTLSALVAAVDEPWRGVLDHQRVTLEALQTSAAELSESSARIARQSARRQRDLLHAVTGPDEPLVRGFGSKSGTTRPAALLVDRSA